MSDQPKTGGGKGYLRIATEEAFAPRQMLDLYRKLLASGYDDPGFTSLWGFYLGSPSPRATKIIERLQDLGEDRIRDMDERGVDRQVIAITAPGVQVLDRDSAVGLAADANDQLGEACAKHPDRFTGMAACAPQDPAAAAREIERAVAKLGFKAVMINGHTQGEYLDAPKFLPILEAAAALKVPIYIHPTTMPRAMVQHFMESGLDGAVYGFGVDTGLHALRLIVSGVFDRLPDLKIIIGHMGEALPFWQYRIDYMHGAGVRSHRYDFLKPLKKPASEYLKSNFYITNSGVAWEPAIRFTQETVGVDNTLYAMDYPYQCDVEEVVALDAMTMDPATKKKFFQTNAEKVFNL
ncbi:MAG: amidohydrolase family protein [Caulobacteraceae bacterium]